jgi:multiple sugar transport system permease protein
MNSIIVSSATAFVSTFVGALAGYGFSRFHFKGRKLLLGFVLTTQMISGVLVIGPYFRIMASLGLYNTRTSLIIAFTTIALPFCIWMTKGFFDSIPKEIDEAAMIDGCSRWTAFLHAGLPLVIPGMVATFLFAFLLAWQDLLWTMSLTSTESTRTVTMAMAFFVGEFRIRWPTLMASTLIGSAPSIIMYACLQRFLVSGFTAGAVKQ